MKYSLYQINFTNAEVNKINKHDPEFKPIYEAYLDSMFGKLSKALELKLHKKVAEIEANDLEQVFEVGNIGPEEKITRLARMHSVSVGDIIVDADNKAFVVASFGFDPVENFHV